jgi:tRNA 5-methylaminomethyl-2-thiouridine biosynthesis bifunctional protein
VTLPAPSDAAASAGGVPAPADRGADRATGLASDALVIGGGLAGAAVAHALARRGWQVRVLDAADHPAAGASSLPAGLAAPHVSADDGMLSQLSRHGLRLTWPQAAALAPGLASQAGLLEHLRRGGARRAVARLEADGLGDATGQAAPGAEAATRPASANEVSQAGLPTGTPCAWHANAGWIQPGALVRHWLSHPAITWQGGSRVEALASAPAGPARWQAFDAQGRRLGQARLVVIAAALGSGPLSGGRLRLQAVRGQVSWGWREPGQALPPFPVNGDGHLLPDVPLPQGRAWLCGSTYGHGDESHDPREADHRANLERLGHLLPQAAAALGPAFSERRVQAWTGVRCASTDRRPLVGPLAPGLWVSTAMGSRGLTFAALCAELLAARLHGEPLPLPPELADALDIARQQPAPFPEGPG